MASSPTKSSAAARRDERTVVQAPATWADTVQMDAGRTRSEQMDGRSTESADTGQAQVGWTGSKPASVGREALGRVPAKQRRDHHMACVHTATQETEARDRTPGWDRQGSVGSGTAAGQTPVAWAPNRDRAAPTPIGQTPATWADTVQTSAQAERPSVAQTTAIAAPAMIDTAAADDAATAIPLASTPTLDSLSLLLTYLQASLEREHRPYPYTHPAICGHMRLDRRRQKTA